LELSRVVLSDQPLAIIPRLRFNEQRRACLHESCVDCEIKRAIC
jgi:hypothetical protein